MDEGGEIPYEFRVLRPDLPREFNRLTRILRKDKVLRYVTAAGLPCSCQSRPPFSFADRCSWPKRTDTLLELRPASR